MVRDVRRAADDAPALPFQSDRVGTDVVVHGCLMRRQMPYSRIMVMIGARDLRQHRQPNDQPQQEEGVGASEGQGSYARAPRGRVNDGM